MKGASSKYCMSINGNILFLKKKINQNSCSVCFNIHVVGQNSLSI